MSKASKSAGMATVPEPTEADAPSAEQVAGFLQGQPEFLLRNPDLLAQLEFAHAVDEGAVSLIEHQVRVLRARNDALQDQLDAQLGAARYNEQLHARLHALCLNLFPATTLAARIAAVEAHVAQLGGDVLGLKLYAESGDVPGAYRAEREHLDFQRQFGTFLRARSPLCGRLQKGQLDYLFGDAADTVQSVALTPLGTDGEVGLMAIGSQDPDRFQAHLGTDFLRQLGETIGQALMATLPAALAEPSHDA